MLNHFLIELAAKNFWVSSAQNRSGFRQTNAPVLNFQEFCQQILPRKARKGMDSLARRARRGSPSAGSSQRSLWVEPLFVAWLGAASRAERQGFIGAKSMGGSASRPRNGLRKPEKYDSGAVTGIRTRVTRMRTWRPRPD